MYSAKKISEKLINDGFSNMTVRKIYYYVFDQKMITPHGNGKQIFTDNDYDKLKSIAFLKEHTKLSLTEIKEEIENKKYEDVELEYTTKTFSTLSDFMYKDNDKDKTDFLSTVSRSIPTFNASTSAISINNCVQTDSLLSSSSSSACSYSNSTSAISNFRNEQSFGSSLTPLPTEQVFYNNLQVTAEDISTEEKKDSHIKIAPGITINYTEKADKEKLKKLIEISKILFDN